NELHRVSENAGARSNEVSALAHSTYPLRQLGRFREAHERLDRALARLREDHAYPATKLTIGSEADETLRAAADVDADTGRIADALAEYRRVLGLIDAAHPDFATNLSNTALLSNLYERMSQLYRENGETARAWDLDERRHALWIPWQQRLPNNSYVQQQFAA